LLLGRFVVRVTFHFGLNSRFRTGGRVHTDLARQVLKSTLKDYPATQEEKRELCSNSGILGFNPPEEPRTKQHWEAIRAEVQRDAEWWKSKTNLKKRNETTPACWRVKLLAPETVERLFPVVGRWQWTLVRWLLETTLDRSGFSPDAGTSIRTIARIKRALAARAAYWVPGPLCPSPCISPSWYRGFSFGGAPSVQ
jgi:hypothetical protein